MSEIVEVERKYTKKPDWLRVKLPIGKEYKEVRQIVSEHKLHTCLLYTSDAADE